MKEHPRFLSVDDLLDIHQDMIASYGGSDGIRDMGLLESAAAMPEAGMAGQYLHTDLFEMGAAYLFHLTSNHPFVDGNKRVGTAAALVFFELNGVRIVATNHAIVKLTLGVARGETTKSAVAEFFRKNSR